MGKGWTTQSEVTFIRHLGTGKWSVDSLAVKERSKGELLALYVAGPGSGTVGTALNGTKYSGLPRTRYAVRWRTERGLPRLHQR